MENVPLDQAKQVLEELVDRARHGEDVRITTADGSAVRLQPIGQITRVERSARPVDLGANSRFPTSCSILFRKTN
jgi:prevent-host-death family protein